MRRDAVRNRELILRTAHALFSLEGLNVTLDDIARKSGIGIGTVYRNFSTKSALIDAVYSDIIRALPESLRTAVQQESDPWHRVSRYINEVCEHMLADRGLRDLLYKPETCGFTGAELRDKVTTVLDDALTNLRRNEPESSGITTTDVIAAIHMLDAVAVLTYPVDQNAWRRYTALTLIGLRGSGSATIDTPPLSRTAMAAAAYLAAHAG